MYVLKLLSFQKILLQMYRAARCWTISIFLMDLDVRGSQIEHEYSNFDLTSTWCAWVFICWFDVFRFGFKKPSALLPFDVMSLMCLSHLRLDCTVIPRYMYLAELTDSSIWFRL